MSCVASFPVYIVDSARTKLFLFLFQKIEPWEDKQG